MPCVVLEVNLATSWWKSRNLHDQSHRYVASQPSSLFWVSTNRFLAMNVSMSLGIIGVHLSLKNTSTMDFKRADSKDIVESTKGFAAKQVSMSFPIYEDIKLFIEKDIKMIWQQHHDEQHHQQ